MISVLRQLPRNSRIISAVRHAAITASRSTSATAAFTKIDWSASGCTCSCGGSVCSTRGEQVADAVHDVDRGGVAGLQDADQHAALAVLAHDVGLRRITRRSRLRRRADRSWHLSTVLIGRSLSSLDRARRSRSTRTSYSNCEISPCRTAAPGSAPARRSARRWVESPFACSQPRIEVDHHLPLLAAVRIRDDRTRHRHQLGAQEVQRRGRSVAAPTALRRTGRAAGSARWRR